MINKRNRCGNKLIEMKYSFNKESLIAPFYYWFTAH